jgi:hypothetical protein
MDNVQNDIDFVVCNLYKRYPPYYPGELWTDDYEFISGWRMKWFKAYVKANDYKDDFHRYFVETIYHNFRLIDIAFMLDFKDMREKLKKDNTLISQTPRLDQIYTRSHEIIMRITSLFYEKGLLGQGWTYACRKSQVEQIEEMLLIRITDLQRLWLDVNYDMLISMEDVFAVEGIVILNVHPSIKLLLSDLANNF